MKICIDCKKKLYENEFPVTKKGNLRTRCKPCFEKAKYIWKKTYLEKIRGRSKEGCEIIAKFKCQPVPILERKYWSFVK